MHPAAYQFIGDEVAKHGPFSRVVEIGSRDINGSVRPLFESTAAIYMGLDLYEGPMVDWAGDAVDFEPESVVDCVVCAEVLEHAPNWKELVKVSASWLRPKGRLLITCAAPNRPAHSGIDGSWTLHEGEYYSGVGPKELAKVLLEAGIVATTKQVGRDTQSSGWKQ